MTTETKQRHKHGNVETSRNALQRQKYLCVYGCGCVYIFLVIIYILNAGCVLKVKTQSQKLRQKFSEAHNRPAGNFN